MAKRKGDWLRETAQVRGNMDGKSLPAIVLSAIMPPNQISVFLEHQGETKRSTLPPNLRTVEQLKSLFLRSFAGLNPTQLQSVAVKGQFQTNSILYL